MDTQKYRALLQVVDCGSITEAASRMGYTQSAVSRMVADLEAHFGVKLLNRGKSGASPTSEARQLLASMRAVCTAEDDLVSQIDAIKGLETGTLRIAAFSSVATHWLPAVVKDLRRDHPGIICELMMGNQRQIEEWVEEGRADCGFTYLQPRASLHARFLGEDEFVAVLPPDHPLAGEPCFPVEAFACEPFLQLETAVEDLVARINAEKNLNIVPALSTFEDYAIMAMVEGGMGLAILPALILKRASYHLATMPLSIPASRTIRLVTRKGPESASMHEFVSYLEAFLANEH